MIEPTAMTVAKLEPDIAAKKAHVIMVAITSPPLKRPNIVFITPTSRRKVFRVSMFEVLFIDVDDVRQYCVHAEMSSVLQSLARSKQCHENHYVSARLFKPVEASKPEFSLWNIDNN
jgi:hypothetical protein